MSGSRSILPRLFPVIHAADPSASTDAQPGVTSAASAPSIPAITSPDRFSSSFISAKYRFASCIARSTPGDRREPPSTVWLPIALITGFTPRSS